MRGIADLEALDGDVVGAVPEDALVFPGGVDDRVLTGESPEGDAVRGRRPRPGPEDHDGRSCRGSVLSLRLHVRPAVVEHFERARTTDALRNEVIDGVTE